MAAANKEEEVDIVKIPLPQLGQLRQQLDKELSIVHDSLQTLKIAQTKFQDSKENLEKLTPSCKGKEILVPLTKSVYVPGRIADLDNVLIDIGTGYYVQKDLEGAKDYFKRKVDFVTENMEKLQKMGIDKNKMRAVIVDTIEQKVMSEYKQRANVKT